MTSEEIQESPTGELVEHGEQSDVEAFAGLIRSLSEPLANSQVVTAQEATKQTQIMADTARSLFRGLIGIALSVVFLAAAALYSGEVQLTEKIVIALLGFLGGFGVGKGVKS